MSSLGVVVNGVASSHSDPLWDRSVLVGLFSELLLNLERFLRLFVRHISSPYELHLQASLNVCMCKLKKILSIEFHTFLIRTRNVTAFSSILTPPSRFPSFEGDFFNTHT